MKDKPLKRPFKLILPDKILRTMNREQYKQIMSWLRYCAREVNKKMDYEAINRAILYGGQI